MKKVNFVFLLIIDAEEETIKCKQTNTKLQVPNCLVKRSKKKNIANAKGYATTS